METAENLTEVITILKRREGNLTSWMWEEISLRVEIAKVAQLELLNKHLAEIGAAIRNKGAG